MTVLLTLTVLTSCSSENTTFKTENTNSSENSDIQSTNSDTLTYETLVFDDVPPDDYTTYYFSSYKAITNNLKGLISEEDDVLSKDASTYGTLYQNALAKFRSGEIKVPIPYSDGKELPLRTRVGYLKAAVLTKEVYNLPCIWYSYDIQDTHLYIKFSHIKSVENAVVPDTTRYVDILNILPFDNLPSPDNYTQFESYSYIYEKEYTLADGKEVTAIVSTFNEDPRTDIKIYYDGMFIELCGYPHVLTDEFMSSFSVVLV